MRLLVFLCHSSTDKTEVRQLYRTLRQDGFDPWLDEENLLPGQDWKSAIEQAVRKSHIVIVCLSKTAVTKEGFIQKEIRYALDAADEKPEGTIFLIPLRFEACAVPDRLSRWHWVDLFDSKGYEKLFRALTTREESLGIAIAANRRSKTSAGRGADASEESYADAPVNIDIRAVFEQFWKWSETGEVAERHPFNKIRVNWERWLTRCGPEQLSRIRISERANETVQQGFIDWITVEWPGKKYPNHLKAGRFVLFQLGHLNPFFRWRLLERFRTGDEVRGFQTVLTEADSRGTRLDIKRIEALLIPEERSEARIYTENFEFADSSILSRSLNAVRTILTERSSLPVKSVFSHPLTVFESAFYANESQRRLNLLESSQIRLIMGGLHGQEARIAGDSVGSALALGILVALDESAPAAGARRGGYWARLFHKVRDQSATFVISGSVDDQGRMTPVSRIDEKLAAVDNSGVKNFVVPEHSGLEEAILDSSRVTVYRARNLRDVLKAVSGH